MALKRLLRNKQWTLTTALISRQLRSGDLCFPSQGQRVTAACCLALHPRFGNSVASFPLVPNQIHFGRRNYASDQSFRYYGTRQGQKWGGGRAWRCCESHDRHAFGGTSISPKYLSGDAAAINEFIDKFDVFLFDCDGVLWSGDHVFEGVVETLELLRSRGKRTVFVTNNSTKSRPEYKKKFESLGIPAEEDEIFGSAYSSAIYISRILKLAPPKNKVFVLGEGGIEQELKTENIPFIGGTDPYYRRDITSEDFEGLADGSLLDPEVGCVLAGLDRHINYLKLSHAYQYLRRGAVFLATNVDSTFPMNHNFFPGAGSISIPLVNMTGQEPVALGKPSQAMMDAIEGKFHLDRARTCMVGDRLNTDIKFGIEGRLGGTLAVLTGVSKKEDWEAADAVAVPAFYVDRLSDLRAAAQ